MCPLALLFVFVPVAELWLLIAIGTRIGVLPTVGIVLATGLAGAWLARREGTGVLRRIRADLERGVLPSDALLDGAIVLFGAALLLTPGVLTDAVGLFALLPPSRAWLKRALRRRAERAVREGRASFVGIGFVRPSGPTRAESESGRATGGGRVLDVEARIEPEERSGDEIEPEERSGDEIEPEERSGDEAG
jgi:UPF0716 protein FxsA